MQGNLPYPLVHVALFLHGDAAQKSIGVEQLVPVKPGLQLQTNELARSMQTLFVGHGLEAHSSMSTSHRRPANPFEQLHVKLQRKITAKKRLQN